MPAGVTADMRNSYQWTVHLSGGLFTTAQSIHGAGDGHRTAGQKAAAEADRAKFLNPQRMTERTVTRDVRTLAEADPARLLSAAHHRQTCVGIAGQPFHLNLRHPARRIGNREWRKGIKLRRQMLLKQGKLTHPSASNSKNRISVRIVPLAA